MIEVIGNACHAGGKLNGRLSWPLDTPLPSGPVTLWLVWRLTIVERGLIDANSSVIEDYVVVEKKRFPAARAIEFELAIPAEGPVSYLGKLFRVDWDIVVGSDAPSLVVQECRSVVVGPRPVADAHASGKAAAGVS